MEFPVFNLSLWPYLSWGYIHFVDLIMTLEWLAWLLCILLYLKGLYYPTPDSPQNKTDNIFKDFVARNMVNIMKNIRD
jgi:hypothetical protein